MDVNFMRKRVLRLMPFLLLLAICLAGLTGCSSETSTQKSLREQMDEFIEQERADGSLAELEEYWLNHFDEGKTFDFDGLSGENGTVKIALGLDKPFTFICNNTYTGFTAELIYRFCKQYGYKPEFSNVGNTNAIVLAVSSGKADFGGGNASITEERKKSVDFSVPYFDNKITYSCRKEDASRYTCIEDLKGARIGATTGTFYPDYIRSNVEDVSISEYNTASDEFMALDGKKVDIVSDDYALSLAILEQYPDLTVAFTEAVDDQYGFIFPKEDSANASFFSSFANGFQRTFLDEDRWKMFAEGILITCLIAFASILFGSAGGFFIFLFCRKGSKGATRWTNRLANRVADLFYGLVDGFPEVVLLMIFYYVIFKTLDIQSTVVSIIVFSILFSSSVFGSLRNSVDTIDRGQYEASYALGYTRNEAFFRIIIPQSLRLFWPQFKSAVKGLIKGTAIVGYISTQDLTKVGDIVRSSTYQALFPLLAVSVLYFAIIAVFLKLIDLLDKATKPSKARSNRFLKGVNRHD